ncbi:MAG: hypothetical protein KAQ96_09705 [Thermoplasmata archaeon]|nr:hypothetical protein [Thermoplasmata archaeon]
MATVSFTSWELEWTLTVAPGSVSPNTRTPLLLMNGKSLWSGSVSTVRDGAVRSKTTE